MSHESNISEFDLYGTRIEMVYNEIIPLIVRNPDKFKLSASIAREAVNRLLQDKNLIEGCHEGLKGSDIFKITGYLSYWIAKLKPIQILEEDPNKTEIYINEYLAITLANSYFFEYDKPQICTKDLIDNLLYLLRYRTLTIRIMPLVYESYAKGYSNSNPEIVTIE